MCVCVWSSSISSCKPFLETTYDQRKGGGEFKFRKIIPNIFMAFYPIQPFRLFNWWENIVCELHASYECNPFNVSEFLQKSVLFIIPVITNVVRPLPVNMAARVMNCVMSTKEDSAAHVRQDTRDTDVKSRYLLDHAKTSWSTNKWQPMESTTLQTNITFHSQSTATLVPSPVPHGLWSSLTPCKTMTPSRAKPSSITTCQST